MCSYFYSYGGVGTYHSLANHESIIRKAGQKIADLYCRYWRVLAFALPVLFACKKYECDVLTVLKSIVGISHFYCAEWWFLLPYIVATVYYSLLFIIFEREKSAVCSFVLLSCLIVCESIEVVLPKVITVSSNPIVSILLSGLSFMPAFLTGAAIAKFDLLGIIKGFAIEHAYIARFAGIIGIITTYFVKSNCASHEYIITVLFLVSIVLIFSQMKSRVIISFGKHSTTIWLTHTIFCYILIPKMFYIFDLQIINYIIFTLFCYLFAFCFDSFFEIVHSAIINKKWVSG